MTTPFDTPDWRGMSQQDRDLGLNNGIHVPESADLVAGSYFVCRISLLLASSLPRHPLFPTQPPVPSNRSDGSPVSTSSR